MTSVILILRILTIGLIVQLLNYNQTGLTGKWLLISIYALKNYKFKDNFMAPLKKDLKVYLFQFENEKNYVCFRRRKNHNNHPYFKNSRHGANYAIIEL